MSRNASDALQALAADGETALRAPRCFLTGLLVTLGDQKAILFYLGFFPAFVNLAALSLADTSLILAVATVAVGGPKPSGGPKRISLIYKSKLRSDHNFL